MSAPPRPRLWTRPLAVTVAIVLAIPVVLGVAIGLFELNPAESEMLSAPGDDAHLLLGSFPDNTLIVEIAYQGPSAPPAAAVSTLLDRIHQTCSKGSVAVDEHEFTDSATTFGAGTLDSLELHVRQHWTVPGTATLFYLYLEGADASDPNIIGVAYHASSIAIFAGTIANYSGAFGATAITTTVLIHEFGHELGLVGVFGHVPNEDLAHPPHSNDPNDVMYWQVDSLGILGLSAPPTTFDAGDLADLKQMSTTIIPYEVLPWAILAVCAGFVLYLVLVERRKLRRSGKAPSATSPPSG